MRAHGFIATLLFGGLLGCAVQEPAPEKPTWVDDVQPILQGNCFHCHGDGPRPEGATRWDVYDLKDAFYMDHGFVEDAAVIAGASSHYPLMAILIGPMAGDNLRMPPPPATRLSDHDLQVLLNWSKTGFTKGKHSPNHKPTIKWLEKPKTFVVNDADGDQVLGKLTCGTDEITISRTGSHELGDVSLPCTAALYDGFEENGGELKK